MKLANRHEIPDPRSFVKPVALPFPSHKGVKIQARSIHVYNATEPPRDEVRRDNYSRRLDQMTSMGFRTPMNVPYRIIGDPLYLDHKRIIWYGLGQYGEIEKENDRGTEFIKPPTNNNNTQEAADKTQPNASGFNIKNLKRSKELYKLQDEVNKTKELIRRVKFGQSYFDIIKKEDEMKKKKTEANMNHLTTSMQLRPMIDSDEEFQESEDEYYLDLNRLNDNNSPAANSIFNQPITPFTSDYQQADKVAKSLRIMTDEVLGKELTSSDLNHNATDFNRPQTFPAHNMSMPSMKRPKTYTGKKSKEAPKPFTPVYSSLLVKEDTPVIDKSSITRQLCVLLWIMESISIEPPVYVGPLRTCFMVKDLGGEKTKENYLGNIKKVDSRWRKFKSNKNEVDKMAELSKPKTRKIRANIAHSDQATDIINEILTDNGGDSNDQEYVREHHPGKRVSETPSSGMYDSIHEEEFNNSRLQRKNPLGESVASINNLFNESINEDNLQHHNLDTTGPINNFSRQVSNIEVSSNQNSDIFLPQNSKDGTNTPSRGNSIPGMSKMRGSLSHNILQRAQQQQHQQNQHQQQQQQQQQSPLRSLKRESTQKTLKSDILQDHELELLKIGDVDEMDRIFNKHSMGRDRRNSKTLKATGMNVHALWTEKVVDFQNSLPSVKKATKIKEIRDKFDSIFDESTIEIHKRLEELLKKRTQTCSIKYLNMDLSQRGIHKMLQKMNLSVIEHQKKEDMKNTPEPKYYQWYSDLENLVVAFYSRDDCILGKLLDKLSPYGKLNSKKQNEALFFKVLDNLRIWELCSPDVMSAIEFCRERILEIQVEDFESWFQTKHPDYFISRNPSNKNIIQIENSKNAPGIPASAPANVSGARQ